MKLSRLNANNVRSNLLVERPRYRVILWEQIQPGLSSPPAYRSHEFEIEDADAPEVIEWSRGQVEKYAGGESVVYVVVMIGSDTCLVRIHGSDPTQTVEFDVG